MNLWWRTRTRVAKDPYDETQITVVHKEEASPASVTRLAIAMLFVVLAAITIGQQLYFQGQREADRKEQAQTDAEFQVNQKKLNATLQDQIRQANLDREKLRGLVLGILTAPTAEQRRKLLEQFASPEPVTPAARPTPTPQRSSRSRDTKPAPNPQDSPKPRPSASSSPSPKPTPKPSPTECTIRNPLTGRCILVNGRK